MEKAGQEKIKKRFKKRKIWKNFASINFREWAKHNFLRLKLSRKWPKFAKFGKVSDPKVICVVITNFRRIS